jgi:riboflavin synthase
MFTGIIETTGTVQQLVREQSNIHITIASKISAALTIDQSVSHDGACLTVVALAEGTHTVTAIEETLRRTNLDTWAVGSLINLERCLPMGGRLDGHIVQGHVDMRATCLDVKETGGSWRLTFEYTPSPEHLLVDKGSICINGISLTVVEPTDRQFSVAIIPYTWEHTNIHQLKSGSVVNLEFDMIGKYIARYMAAYGKIG